MLLYVEQGTTRGKLLKFTSQHVVNALKLCAHFSLQLPMLPSHPDLPILIRINQIYQVPIPRRDLIISSCSTPTPFHSASKLPFYEELSLEDEDIKTASFRVDLGRESLSTLEKLKQALLLSFCYDHIETRSVDLFPRPAFSVRKEALTLAAGTRRGHKAHDSRSVDRFVDHWVHFQRAVLVLFTLGEHLHHG